MFKRLLIVLFVFAIICGAGFFLAYQYLVGSLPKLITVNDYKPLLVSQVYDRNNKKIGEFFRERRVLTPYKDIPKNLVNAFLAAEDDQFFEHSGINYIAIIRASLANLRAGKKVQGASTITQQVAKTLLLVDFEKTFLRKAKEALLAQEMEKHLSKEDILYLYLNQIYFGQGANGVALAADTYFRKPVAELTLPEAALLAGLAKAPTAYSPVTNPVRAKERQAYVLKRMADVGFIKHEEAEKAIQQPIKIYTREKYQSYAPFFLETVRQLLVSTIGETKVLDEGIKVYTSLDLEAQLKAQESMVAGLKELDKRQGFRGPLKNVTEPKEVGEFLMKTRDLLISEVSPERIIQPDGHFIDYGPLDVKYDLKKGIPFYIKVGKTAETIISKIDDDLGLVYVRMAELEGIIDFETMQWARKPNSEKRYDLDRIKKPSQALKVGDVVLAKLAGEKFASARLNRILSVQKKTLDLSKYVEVELDQEPIAEASLISFDQDSEEVMAMIGGYNFAKSEYNRALQAARQTGSSFKSIVYASAIDKGYTAATPIMDAPIVYEETIKKEGNPENDEEGQEDTKTWKPSNHSKSFGGDIIFRNALVKSLNVPAVKIIQDVKVDWAADYARRMGIYSPLNMDFTLALGSSSVTLYEMTKVFSEFGRQGKKIKPVIIKSVVDSKNQKISEKISLDLRFESEISAIEKNFEERRAAYLEKQKTEVLTEEQLKERHKTMSDSNFFFDDADQLIKPTTAYLMTSLLKAVVEDSHGTGGGARALGRDVAGKTGSTNGYYDAWFIGYTPQIATGVWVGFDQERSLGKGEVGGRAALPIWNGYMKAVHENLPQVTFPVPEGIVFANIDSDTGELASGSSKNIIRQAFLEGTEPTTVKNKKEEDSEFYKDDLSN